MAILILFNTVGYVYVLNWNHQYKLDQKAKELLDAHISEISGNLIFTVPVTQIYQSKMTEYTRIDGEIQFEGVTYRMVKQRVHENLLYVVCVTNEQARVATEEINEIIAAVAGNSGESSTSNAKVLLSFLKYCDISTPSETPGSAGWFRDVVFSEYEDSYRYNGSYSLFHPPSVI